MREPARSEREVLPIPDPSYDGPVLLIPDAAEDIDHLISPEERLKLAMARQ